MSHLADAHAFIEPIAAARRTRGHHVTDEQLERAAALLADLWAAAARHGITPNQPGYHTQPTPSRLRHHHRRHPHRTRLDHPHQAPRRRLTNPLTEAMQDFLVTDPAPTRPLVAELAAHRRAHGRHISSGQAEQAAALPADLWTAAARQSSTPDHWGYYAHLPHAALDTISTPPRRPPAKRQRRPQPWQHRQGVDR